MDEIMDSLDNAYQDFVVGGANFLVANKRSEGEKAAEVDVALENFKQKWELFRVSCDQAEEFVEFVKQRVGSESLVDEATVSAAVKSELAGTAGISPIYAVRLEQMSKAVRWLAIELQQGSGSGAIASSAHSQSSTPFDAKFFEEPAQQRVAAK